MTAPYFILPDGTHINELKVGGAGVHPTVTAHDALFGFIAGCDLQKHLARLEKSSEEYDAGCDGIRKLVGLRDELKDVEVEAPIAGSAE